MNGKTMASLALGAVLGIAGAAHAGVTHSYQVGIDLSARTASGSLQGARASGDSTQYISCSTERLWNDSGYVSTSCWAMDAQGRSLACFSSRGQIAEVARTVNPASHITFSALDNGECRSLRVNNSSGNLPPPASSRSGTVLY